MILLSTVVWRKRYCAANRGLVLTDCAPADAQRNNNFIMTSKLRRFDVTMALLLRWASAGAQSVNTRPLFAAQCLHTTLKICDILYIHFVCIYMYTYIYDIVVNLHVVITDCVPTYTQCNNNVIMTLLLRWASAGAQSVNTRPLFAAQ